MCRYAPLRRKSEGLALLPLRGRFRGIYGRKAAFLPVRSRAGRSVGYGDAVCTEGVVKKELIRRATGRVIGLWLFCGPAGTGKYRFRRTRGLWLYVVECCRKPGGYTAPTVYIVLRWVYAECPANTSCGVSRHHEFTIFLRRSGDAV